MDSISYYAKSRGNFPGSETGCCLPGKRKYFSVIKNVDRFFVIIYVAAMNSKELKRWLAKQGCTFQNHTGGSGHITVTLGDKEAQLPMHGHGKELGNGLVQAILKELGLKN
jgi:mRNA interferase HicA